MAKFSAMAVTTNVKQGLERGPQGVIQSATFDIPKQMATTFIVEKVLGLKYLSGTGLVNPALTVNLGRVVSGLKEGVRRLIEGTSTQNLSSVGAVSGRTDEPTVKEKPPVSAFKATGDQGNTLYRTAETPASKKDISKKGEAFTQQNFSLRTGSGYSTLSTRSAGTAAVSALPPNASEQSKVQPVVNARRDPIDSVAVSTDQQFSNLRPSSPTVLSSTDFRTPAVPVYPRKLEGKKLTENTHPFIAGPLATKPILEGVTTFPFLRSPNMGVVSTDLKTGETKIKPPALSAVQDTFAGQPYTGPEADLDEVQRAKGKRSGIFLTKKVNTATYSSPSKMSLVRKRLLTGSTFQGYEEFAQSHRFYIADVTGDQQSVFEWEENGSPPTTLAAGFSNCSAPKMELASKEVKEGTWEFPRVFCTGANAQTITLSKGLVKTETAFYFWVLNAMRGKLTRRTIKVVSYGRNRLKPNAWSKPETLDDVSSCVWTLYNCYPIGYRASGDWDGDSGKIQLSELEMHYEWFKESEGTLYHGTSPASA